MRQWAIVVGLNNYQFFQPLSCAQQDAQALHQFLIEEVGFSAENCLLLTDTSPPLWGNSTQPTRANLLRWIEWLAQNGPKPGDSLCFFFCGYGVSAQGRDYLAPLDGDPFAVETTCILMSSIFSRLQAAISPGMLLLMFDINRSQGMFSSERVGIQTAQLAKQFAVPTILSCRPDQFSREISSLGHGLFTVGLLEGLRYYQGATPATLMQFLSDRLPELSQYYYLPSQQPVSICPFDKLHQTLLLAHYTTQTSKDLGTNESEIRSEQGRDNSSGQETVAGQAAITSSGARSANPSPILVTSNGFVGQDLQKNGRYNGSYQDSQSQDPNSVQGNSLKEGSPSSYRAAEEHLPLMRPASAGTIANGASATLPQPELTNVEKTTVPHRNSEITSSTVSSNGNKAMNSGTVSNATSSEAMPPEASTEDRLPRRVFWLCGLLSLGLIGGVLWRNWSAIWAMPQPAIATSPSVVVPASPVPEQNPEQIRPTSAVDPSTQASANSASSQNPATGQEVLANARRMVWSDQATPYRDAIAEAKRILPNDPAYAEAQQDIAVWSQIILNIAQQRANQKQWDIAIMAADLVPPENQQLRSQSQALLTEWCPMVKNQPVQFFPMQQAKSICSQQAI